MRSYHLILSVFASAAFVGAQTIVPSSSTTSFPGCALSCGVLLSAQAACIPPTSAVATQITYDNCFCHYSTLQGIYTNPDGVCTAECAIEADRVLLRTWFIGFCGQVAQGIAPAEGDSTPTTLQASTSAGSATGAITLHPNASSTGSASSHGPAWFPTHWRWIVMIIVLFIGFVLIALLALFLKKRHKRKREERIAQMSGFAMTQKKGGNPALTGATPDLWGPHQHMAATQGYQYSPGGLFVGSSARRSSRRRSKSKTKGENMEIDEIDEIKPDQSNRLGRVRSSRPRPSELDVDLRAAESQRGRDKKAQISERNLGQDSQGLHKKNADEKDEG